VNVVCTFGSDGVVVVVVVVVVLPTIVVDYIIVCVCFHPVPVDTTVATLGLLMLFYQMLRVQQSVSVCVEE
jgi:hypothetical protein